MSQEYIADAILTINGAPAMSKEGVEQICSWLAKQQDALRTEHQTYSKRFRARYLHYAGGTN